MQHISKILAVVLHPLLVPTYLYITLSFFSQGLIGQFSISQILILTALVFVSTFVVPLLLVLIVLTYQNDGISFNALLMNNATQRIIPFSLTGIYYMYLAYYIYSSWSSQLIMAIVLASIGVCIMLAALISRYYKISAHAIGIGGFVGFCAALNIHYLQSNLFYMLLVALLLSGVLLGARLYAKAHTPSEVYAGWAMGVSICYLSNFLI